MRVNQRQLADLKSDFKRLSVDIRARTLTSSLKDAAKPMRDKARQRTPVRTGKTRRSINWKKVSDVRFNGIQLQGSYVLNFLEKGTAPRRRKRGGFTGSGPAYNIQRGAFDSTYELVTDRFSTSLRRKIDLRLR